MPLFLLSKFTSFMGTKIFEKKLRQCGGLKFNENGFIIKKDLNG